MVWRGVVASVIPFVAGCGSADPIAVVDASSSDVAVKVDAASDAGTLDASSVDASDDTGVVDASKVDASDGGVPMVSIAGTIHHMDDTPLAGATVGFFEDLSLTAATNSFGVYQLLVPAETPLTIHIKASGLVPTVSQTAVFHSATSGANFRVPTPSEYTFMGSFGSVPNGSGIMRMDVVWKNACGVVGAHLGVNPTSGTVVYAQSDQLPNATYTAIQPNAPGAYVIGVTGTPTPFIKDVTSPCAQTPWPHRQHPRADHGRGGLVPRRHNLRAVSNDFTLSA